MSFLTEFSDLLLDTVSLAPLTGTDDYSVPQYGAPVDYACRIVFKNRLVRTRDGSQVVSSHHLWLTYVEAAAPTWQLTMPDGSTPTILSIEKFKDTSAHHMKIYLQ